MLKLNEKKKKELLFNEGQSYEKRVELLGNAGQVWEVRKSTWNSCNKRKKKREKGKVFHAIKYIYYSHHNQGKKRK